MGNEKRVMCVGGRGEEGRGCVLVGSLSNNDADGNENGKKAIGLISKTTSLHVHHAFSVHFFAVVA